MGPAPAGGGLHLESLKRSRRAQKFCLTVRKWPAGPALPTADVIQYLNNRQEYLTI